MTLWPRFCPASPSPPPTATSATPRCGRSGTRATPRAVSGCGAGGPTVRSWSRSPGSRRDGCSTSAAVRVRTPSGSRAAAGTVTALEVSGVALERAGGHARDAGVRLLGARRTGGGGAAAGDRSIWSRRSTRRCCARRTRRPSGRCWRPSRPAVCCCSCTTRGWTPSRCTTGGFDPADYVWPTMVAALLDEDWAGGGRRAATADRSGGRAPARTTSTTWCCARAGCADAWLLRQSAQSGLVSEDPVDGLLQP